MNPRREVPNMEEAEKTNLVIGNVNKTWPLYVLLVPPFTLMNIFHRMSRCAHYHVAGVS
jgi:hypothetical protein